jgi:putative acetyltransferase
MTTIDIRPYRAADAAELVQLFRSAVRAIPRSDYSQAQLAAWAPDEIDVARFAQRCAAKSTWIADCGGNIAGFSDLEGDGHVDMLYVHPAFQRRGVARALLSHIEGVARERGLARLYTEASITARPAFEARGFVVLAAQIVARRGEDFTNYRMEKPLSASPRAP